MYVAMNQTFVVETDPLLQYEILYLYLPTCLILDLFDVAKDQTDFTNVGKL